MKRFFIALPLGVLAVALLPVSGYVQAAHPRASMSLAVVSVKPTTVTKKKAAVTFRLHVKGITLDTSHMGKKNVSGHGHLQVYVDKIPSDAYSKKDLKHHWLASLAAPVFTLSLKPAVLGGTGKHKVIVALAQNNDVLYHSPTVSISLTAM